MKPSTRVVLYHVRDVLVFMAAVLVVGWTILKVVPEFLR